MIFLPAMMSTRILLHGKISTRLTAPMRHRDIDNREIDGAVHWSSLSPKLRRDFEREGVRTFSDSQWLCHVCTEEATIPDFSTAQTRTATFCMFAPSEVTQEES